MNEIRVPFLENHFPSLPPSVKFLSLFLFQKERFDFSCVGKASISISIKRELSGVSRSAKRERGKGERMEREKRSLSPLPSKPLVAPNVFFVFDFEGGHVFHCSAGCWMPLHDFPLYPGVRRIKGGRQVFVGLSGTCTT